VINDEGLRSYKAIAFIKSNQWRLSLKTKTYLLLGALLQRTVLAKQETLSGFSKNLGENYG
jgi:hypothetical protein